MDKTEKYTTLPGMIVDCAHRFSNHIALIDPIRENEFTSITYQELWTNILKITNQLMSRKVVSGDRIGLLANGRSWWPTCDFSIMAAGAWTVPIYSSLPANQVQYIIRHSGMRGIFVENKVQLAKVLESDESLLPELEFIVLLEAMLSGEEMPKSPWQLYSYYDWLGTVIDVNVESAVLDRISRIHSTDVASIVYTSGTTGFPKGVLLTHDNFLSNVESIRGAIELSSFDKTLSYLPLSHIFERTAGQFFTLRQGGTISYSRGFAYIQEDLKQIKPTIMTSVPRLLEKIYEHIHLEVSHFGSIKKFLFQMAFDEGTKVRVKKEKRASLILYLYDKFLFGKIKDVFGSELRNIVVGGAPLPPQVGSFFTAAGVQVLEGYGMTETSPVVAVNRPMSVQFGTVGLTVENVEISIAKDGELLVKGPNVSQGYYKDEEATKELLSDDGWLHTGDIAEITDTGYLKITDRKKNLIILSTGKKVAPAPIESDILDSPLIDQVLVIGQNKKYVSAIVVPTTESLREWLEESGGTFASSRNFGSELIYQKLMGEVIERTKTYALFERPKKLIIAKEPFTTQNGLLTPTLKVRAKAVIAAYQTEIDALYEDGPEAQSQTVSS